MLSPRHMLTSDEPFALDQFSGRCIKPLTGTVVGIRVSLVFAISETLGFGQSSVLNLVCSVLGDLEIAACCTTRPRRQTPNTADSSFVFTSRRVFEHMIARNEFLEQTSILGNYYGTPRSSFERARAKGRDLIVRVDHREIKEVTNEIREAINIMILPGRPPDGRQSGPSVTNLGQPSFIRNLFAHHAREVIYRHAQNTNMDDYDYVVTNNGLEPTVARMVDIIRFERIRRK